MANTKDLGDRVRRVLWDSFPGATTNQIANATARVMDEVPKPGREGVRCDAPCACDGSCGC